MNRWTKVKAVATFEFLAAVKRPGYLITTFGMPLFLAAYGGIVAIPAYYAAKSAEEAMVYGVVDRAGVLKLTGDAKTGGAGRSEAVAQALAAAGQSPSIDQLVDQDADVTFRPYGHEADAKTALVRRTIRGYFVLPADYLSTGVIERYVRAEANLTSNDARRALDRLLRERLLSGRVEPVAAARILEPVRETRAFAVTPEGEVRDGGEMASALRFAVPLAFMVLFLMSILMSSGFLMQGTAIEKENKVVEVLLASVNPDELLAGKLAGLGAAGLLQIGVWLAMVLVAGVGVGPMLLATKIEMPWVALALAVPLFLEAFLFFGSLILGTGSLGATMRESQQLAMVWSLTAALPLMLLGVLLKSPHGLVARILTLVPFTAGPLVVLRASMDPHALGWWEVVGAVVVLAVCTVIGLRVGARLFRIGLLSAGSRPSLKEVWRQARLAD